MSESGASTRQFSALSDFVSPRVKRRRGFVIGLICAIAMGSLQQVGAQTFRGTILGTITDPQNAVVAGATVTAKNVGTGIQRMTVTDDVGNFTIPELPIGVYEVNVQATGFKLARVTDVKVE